MEVLVARIALYPDELIAVITAASLYPLQIVEAARYLDQYAKDKNLKPKDSWDGSVISLLNYPDVVKMMSDDLEWTQSLGDAIAYQQKDVLVAIQQLRDEAVAKGVIKTDDKMQVVEENDNVVIKSTNPEVIYVPQYEPQMLYEPNYAWQPISYYPDPYPNYWYPGATFFAGAVTGAIWAAAVDWDDWGVWGGGWDGGDLDIDCNDCFNNRDFNGKVDFNDVDWKNVDRSKINVDRDQLNKLDRNNIKNRIDRGGNNAVRDRARDIKKRDQVANRGPGKTAGTRDVRKSTLDGLKGQGGQAANRPATRPAAGNRPSRQARRRPTERQPQARRGQPQSRQAEAWGKSRQPLEEALGARKPKSRQGDQGEFQPRPQVDGRRPAAAVAATSRSGGQAAAAAVGAVAAGAVAADAGGGRR